MCKLFNKCKIGPADNLSDLSILFQKCFQPSCIVSVALFFQQYTDPVRLCPNSIFCHFRFSVDNKILHPEIAEW